MPKSPGTSIVLLLQDRPHRCNIWDVMRERLHHDGFPTVSLDPGDALLPSLFDSGPRLGERLEHWLEVHLGHEPRLHLVTYSSGAALASAYLSRPSAGRRVASLVTLAPRGARLLAALPRRLKAATACMRRAERANRVEAVPTTRILPLSRTRAAQDWLSNKLDTAAQTVWIPRAASRSLCWDPGVYRIVRDRIRAAESR